MEKSLIINANSWKPEGQSVRQHKKNDLAKALTLWQILHESINETMLIAPWISKIATNIQIKKSLVLG